MSRVRHIVAAFLFALPALHGCQTDLADHAQPQQVFGSSGLGPGEFNYPRASALAPNGTLYVVDKAARIQAFDSKGTFLFAWKMPAQNAGRPTGLGIAADGRVFAADTHYSRVVVFSPTGELLEMFGEHGDQPGQFRLPTDVAIGPDGAIYVSEYGGNDRITVFEPDWTFRQQIGGPGSDVVFQRPQSLCVATDGTIWVADSCNHRIVSFAPNGTLRNSFGTLGGQQGALRFPYNVDQLADGTIVVCEFGNNRVQRFTQQGESLGVWGRAGRDPGQLAYPWALTVGPDQQIFVIDSGNSRVQVLHPNQIR